MRVPERDRSAARASIVRRTILPTLAVAALLLGATAAQAAPFVDVTYDLGDSTATSNIPIIQASTTIPPDGTLRGTQTLRYTSDSASGLATGPVDLLTFNLYVNATNVARSIYIATHTAASGTGVGKTRTKIATSDLHIEFLGLTPGAPTGQLLAGGTVVPGGAQGIFRVTGYQHCYLYCGVIGVPASTVLTLRPDTFTAPLPTLTGAIGPSHTVRGTATGVAFMVEPVGGAIGIQATGTTKIVGREVLRVPVPEPGTLPLAALGLAALAASATILRWRARA